VGNKYRVILADPPWAYNNKNTGGSMKSGASAKYKTMGVEEICALPVADICERDSVLFLWVTNPMLQEGLQVLEAWGFKYKTMLTWYKEGRKGLGYWFRGQTEHILFGVRGKVKAFRCQRENFISHKLGQHSEKPECFRELIELAAEGFSGDKMELFATKKVDGWKPLGFSIDGRHILESLSTEIHGDNDILPFLGIV